LEVEGFKEVVVKSWTPPCNMSKSIDVWKFKIRNLRINLKGWAINRVVEQNRCKKQLIAEYDVLDLTTEEQPLSPGAKQQMKQITGELQGIWRNEEIKARQRAREKDIMEGDSNTAYFHAMANKKRRRKNITALEGTDGEVHDTEGMYD
jgi:hypothetical protein